MKKLFDMKLLKFIGIVTTITMFVAHGFCYFNILYSHDSLNIFHAGYYGDSLGIGRFLIPVWTFLRGSYYPPIIIGVLSTIFMIFTIYYICKLFEIKDKILILLITLLTCTCSTITLLNATYINYADMYIFCILLNVISVYLIRKNNKLSYLAIITLLITFAIYPAYLSVTLGLYIGMLIKDLSNDKNKKEIFKEGIKCMLITIVSLIAYIILNKLLLRILNYNLSHVTNSISNALNYSNLGTLTLGIKQTYSKYFEYLFKPHTFHKTLYLILNIVLIVIAIYNCIKIIKNKNLKKQNFFLILLLCLILPFILNIIYFITVGVTHELMIFGINITYVFIILLLSDKTKLNKAAYMFLMIIAFCNIVYSNQVYEKKNLELKATISTMNRVIYKVENTDGYEVGKTPVVIIGSLNNGPLAIKQPGFDYEAVGLFGSFSTTYHKNYYRFIKYYMGHPINIVDKEDTESKTAKEFASKYEVQKMPFYPNEGSIKMIDDYLIIKFSN